MTDGFPLIVVACGMCVPTLYLFRLHRPLLLEGASAQVVQWLLIGFALVGGAIAIAHHFDRDGLGTAVALACPALHLRLFRVMFRWFVRKVGREPENVVLNVSAGLAPDRAFAMIVFLVCVVGTMIVPAVVAGPSSNGRQAGHVSK